MFLRFPRPKRPRDIPAASPGGGSDHAGEPRRQNVPHEGTEGPESLRNGPVDDGISRKAATP